ncbi:MAG: hypothetical protein LBN30_10080 [Oscillospiraceae bacterium]|jgi:epoxyqueuosine reductase|nr:hypothetical protein [Oscillospiraceae bacterium]
MARLTDVAARNGVALRVIPVSRLAELRESTAAFVRDTELSPATRQLLSLASYDVPELPFTAQSLIIAATASYSYCEVTFRRAGRDYPVYAALIHPYETAAADEFLAAEAANSGFHYEKSDAWLPYKQLGVSSGLAVYGRNNITYTPEHGSFFVYSAYFSDVPPECDEWRDFAVAEQCASCGSCVRHCLTGALDAERYMLDVSRCYSMLTMNAGEFPPFVPSAAHHTISRCLRCQMSCPMNRESAQNALPPVTFNENETEFVLSGASYDGASEELRGKAKLFGLGMYPSVPRNLRVCFDLIDSGAVLTYA